MSKCLVPLRLQIMQKPIEVEGLASWLFVFLILSLVVCWQIFVMKGMFEMQLLILSMHAPIQN